jgi:DNA polymerase-3 subunit chi
LNSQQSNPQAAVPVGTGEVIFIVLTSANKNRAVCDIVEKYFYQDMHIVLRVEDDHEAKKYDQLLWTWKQSSFIPHVYLNTIEEKTEEPVVISTKVDKNIGFNVLLMVNPVPIEVMRQFRIIIDFAEKYDLALLQESRGRYKEFKKHHFNMKAMQLGQFLSLKN